MDNIETKRKIMTWFCELFAQFTIEKGKNEGDVVKFFQRYIGKAVREAWCMASMQRLISLVDSIFNLIFMTSGGESVIYKSEHCLTTWHKSPVYLRRKEPEVGLMYIAQLHTWLGKPTSSGHTGWIVGLSKCGEYMMCFEGNTRGDNGQPQGFHFKRRHVKEFGRYKIIGFLNPWG